MLTESVCPHMKLEDILSYMLPLRLTSGTCGNAGNLRALTSPLNLKNEQGLGCLSDRVSPRGFTFRGLLMSVNVDGEG